MLKNQREVRWKHNWQTLQRNDNMVFTLSIINKKSRSNSSMFEIVTQGSRAWKNGRRIWSISQTTENQFQSICFRYLSILWEHQSLAALIWIQTIYLKDDLYFIEQKIHYQTLSAFHYDLISRAMYLRHHVASMGLVILVMFGTKFKISERLRKF